jgi:hypothetical protein
MPAISRTRRVAALLSVVVAGCNSATKGPTIEDARRSVADFYTWYVPLARSTPEADMRAIRERQASFSTGLVEALRADSIARAGSPSEVVGLDGDPFLNSQDPCDRYAPIGASERDGRFFVEILGSGGCASHTAADVTVEAMPTDHGLVFTNFVYSSKPRADLLSTLSDLAAARRPGAKRPD